MDNIVYIGASAGGVSTLCNLFSALDKNLNIPIVLVIHRLKNVKSHLDSVLQQNSKLPVKEVTDKEKIKNGKIYLAPANYHMLVEKDYTFSLNVDELVNFSRPSIDVSFISAAEIFGSAITGIILTGANADGAKGLQLIKARGGRVIVQDPVEAQVKTMPMEALKLTPDARQMSLMEIASEINKLHNK